MWCAGVYDHVFRCDRIRIDSARSPRTSCVRSCRMLQREIMINYIIVDRRSLLSRDRLVVSLIPSAIRRINETAAVAQTCSSESLSLNILESVSSRRLFPCDFSSFRDLEHSCGHAYVRVGDPWDGEHKWASGILKAVYHIIKTFLGRVTLKVADS